MQTLIHLGADFNHLVNDDISPIDKAAINKGAGAGLVSFMLDHGADASLVSKDGYPAINWQSRLSQPAPFGAQSR